MLSAGNNLKYVIENDLNFENIRLHTKFIGTSPSACASGGSGQFSMTRSSDQVTLNDSLSSMQSL